MPNTDPIFISPEARKELTALVRDWTGWPKARLHIGGVPDHAAAMCLHEEQSIRIDLEKLVLNPNRVLLTINPFRLRQEGVLTGALMHEAAHARYTHWKPRTVAEMTSHPLLHGDGTEPTPQTVTLARLFEEPRVECRILEQSKTWANGRMISDLGWTMRAAAAHVVKPTAVSEDPDQAVMDVLASWVLRAGRQYAYEEATHPYTLPHWVFEFDALLYETVTKNLARREEMGARLERGGAQAQARYIGGLVKDRCRHIFDTTTYAIDGAREVLELLFPETPEEAGAGGGAGADAPVSIPVHCQSSASPSTDEDEDEDGTDDTDKSGESGESEDGAGDSDGDGESEGNSVSELEQALAESERSELEQSLQGLEEGSAEEEAEATRKAGSKPGGGPPRAIGGGWRLPSKEERDVQSVASKFLRDLIEPSEATDRSLSEQPSAMVDGAALSAWKAGGQTRDPHFFVRTRRSVEPTPPVQVAVLVDVSSSMKILQKPSALLSWALASAALDLRNFAGRGTQVESCLIHWGTGVEVVQEPGQLLKGIREVPCDQGTTAMDRALGEVQRMMPGFFDVPERPVNRLLVQFTDWGLWGHDRLTPWIQRTLASGVNMLSVVPPNYSYRYSPLGSILQECKIQNGSSFMVRYNEDDPDAVWTTARDILRDPTVRLSDAERYF